MHSHIGQKGLPDSVVYDDGDQITVFQNTRASVLHVNQFKCSLYFYNNTFRNNLLYGRLAPISTLLDQMDQLTLESSLFSSNMGYKWETVISIMKQESGTVEFVDNVFQKCAGLKGPILINLIEWTPQWPSVIILRNTFKFCSGLYSSATLYFLSQLDFYFIDDSNLLPGYDNMCGGFALINNTFEYNTVFSYGGIIRTACEKHYQNQGQTPIQFYVIGETMEYYLSTQEFFTNPEWNNEYLDVMQSRYAKSLTLMNGEVVQDINKFVVLVRNNTFRRNFRGEGSIILKFDRSPYVQVYDNVFEANGDLAIYHYATDKEDFMKSFTALRSNQVLLPQDSAAAGIIFSNSALGLDLQNNLVRNNWSARNNGVCSFFLYFFNYREPLFTLPSITIENQVGIATFHEAQIYKEDSDYSGNFILPDSLSSEVSCSLIHINATFDTNRDISMSLSNLQLSNISFKLNQNPALITHTTPLLGLTLNNCTFSNLSISSISQTPGISIDTTASFNLSNIQLLNVTAPNIPFIEAQSHVTQPIYLSQIKLESSQLASFFKSTLSSSTPFVIDNLQAISCNLTGPLFSFSNGVAQSIQLIHFNIEELSGENYLFQFGQTQSLLMNNITFVQRSTSPGFLKLTAVVNAQINENNLTFAGNNSGASNSLMSMTLQSSSISIHNSTLNFEEIGLEGAILALQGEGEFKMRNISLTGVRVFLQDKTSLNVTQSIFQGYNLSGSVLVLSQDSALFLHSSTVKKNVLQEEASFIVSIEQSYVILSDLQVFKNSFTEGRFVNQISTTSTPDIINNVTFQENTGGESLLFFQYSEFQISNSSFLETSSSLADIYLLEATGSIYNSSFQTHNSSVSQFILATENSTLTLNSIDFQTIQSQQDVAIDVEVDSSLFIFNSSFIYNSSFESAQAIHSETTNKIQIQNTSFWSNATTSGVALYIIEANNASITNCRFYGQSNLIQAESSLFELKNSSFLNLDFSLGVSLISLVQSKGLITENNRFQNISASQGGIIQIVGSSQEIELMSNNFVNLTLSKAAVQLDSESEVAIMYNNFTKVVAREHSQGGAVKIGVSDSAVRVQNNSFIECLANQGGAVYWYNYEPPNLLKDNVFTGNMASAYGPDLASYPVTLRLVKQEANGILEEVTAIYNQTSAGFTAGYSLILVDKYGQQVVTAPAEEVLVFQDPQYAQGYSNKFPALKISNNIYSSSGVYDLSSLQLIADPGAELLLQVSTSAINPAFPQVTSSSLNIPVFMAVCTAGNALESDGSCVPCERGSYLLIAPTSVISCKECPATANCTGSSNLHPLAGYWRETAQSDALQNCYNAAACTGYQSTPYDPESICHPGYRGVLCAQCESNYVRNSSFQCAKCPDIWWNGILLAIILILSIIGVVIFLRVTMSSMAERKSNISVFTKILMSHIQILVLTASFDFDWPAEIHSLFSTAHPVANVSDRIISIDCFLNSKSRSNKIFIIFLFYLLLPLFLSSVSFLFWTIKLSCSRHARSKTITTVVILFFLFHPAVSDALFSLYNCRSINGKSRLLDDLDILCFSGSHQTFALIGISGLLIWALGIPLGACLLLYRNRKSLISNSTKEKYGFLYNGYRLEAYYWESITMFRKLGMIFISVFLRSIGTIVQAFAVFLLLLAFVVITVHKKPYRERALNDLEVLSLLASCVSIYAGFFFLAAKSRSADTFNVNKDFVVTQESKWILFLAVVLSNALFLFYWFVGFAGQLRDKVKEKYPRFYFCCCLCNRISLLQEEERLERVKEEANTVLDKIEECQRKMSKIRDMIRRNKIKRAAALELTSNLSSLFNKRDELQKTADLNQPMVRSDTVGLPMKREKSAEAQEIDISGILAQEEENMTIEYTEPLPRKKSTISRIRKYSTISLRKNTLKYEEELKTSRKRERLKELDAELDEPAKQLAFLDEEIEYDCSFVEEG